MNQTTYACYIGAFYLENLKGFRGRHSFDLLDEQGQLNQWTVILGNNNSGKTNILKALAGIEPQKDIGSDGISPLALLSKGNVSREFYRQQDLLPCVEIEILYSSASSEVMAERKDFLRYSNLRPANILWGFRSNSDIMLALVDSENRSILESLNFYTYGVTRRAAPKGLSNISTDNAATLFDPSQTLISIEDWLMQLDYAQKGGNELASKRLGKIKDLIRSGIFPDIEDFRFETTDKLENLVRFKTSSGAWSRFEDLGYGYQSTLSWLIDLCKKMFERYPQAENPLAQPAVVLLDEIELHLHPSWQRQIVRFLSELLPATQFIVTSHSPLILQSLDKLNLFILDRDAKTGDISVHSHKTSLKGWSVEEILREKMQIEEGTHSAEYHQLMQQFQKALDEDDYPKAKAAYEALDKILHPSSTDHEILKIQFSQVLPHD